MSKVVLGNFSAEDPFEAACPEVGLLSSTIIH